MKEGKAENQEIKIKVIQKHDKDLFPPVAHNTIVRPRFLRGYGINETWVTKVVNEKSQTIDFYHNDNFDEVEKKYKEFLKRY